MTNSLNFEARQLHRNINALRESNVLNAQRQLNHTLRVQQDIKDASDTLKATMRVEAQNITALVETSRYQATTPAGINPQAVAENNSSSQNAQDNMAPRTDLTRAELMSSLQQEGINITDKVREAVREESRLIQDLLESRLPQTHTSSPAVSSNTSRHEASAHALSMFAEAPWISHHAGQANQPAALHHSSGTQVVINMNNKTIRAKPTAKKPRENDDVLTESSDGQNSSSESEYDPSANKPFKKRALHGSGRASAKAANKSGKFWHM